MRKRPLSASSIKTFLQCALKYYFRYEDKKPREGKSEALAFGIAVHEALEFLHQRVADTGAAPTPEDYDEVLEVFMKSAARHGLQNMDTYQEGRDMIISRLDNIDPTEKAVGLELRFELETPNGTPFTGSIDKLIELDPETAVIIDYKTSKMALSQEEADVDIQLSMYDLAVSMMFPQYTTIVCAFDYLRLSEVVTHRTPEQRQTFIEFLDAVYSQINELEEDDVKPELNFFCPWCDFKNFCPDYKRLVEDPDLVLPLVGELSDQEFVEGWESLGAAKKIVEKRQQEFKSEVYQRMRRSETVQGETKEIYKIQPSRMNYNAKTVFQVVGQDDFLRMSSVSKTAVDKYLRDNPDKAEKIESTASFSYFSPSFRVRKKQD